MPVQVEVKKNPVRQKKVAVTGSGPACLSCAHDLALMGYGVTVFEATPVAGGMLRHGIPEYRLSRTLIDKEIDKVKSLGVEIRFDTPLTAKFGIKELRKRGFDAVFISVGTQKGRDLNIEGANLDGVIKAIDYLLNISNGYRVNLGKRVLVIGGGFVVLALGLAREFLQAPDGYQNDSNGQKQSTAPSTEITRTQRSIATTKARRAFAYRGEVRRTVPAPPFSTFPIATPSNLNTVARISVFA